MLKRILALGVCAVVAAGTLVACGDKAKEGQAADGSSVVANEKAVKTSKDVDVARSFVDAVKAKDYDSVIQCLNIDADKAFLSAGDIEFALPRSSFAELADESVQDATVDLSSSYQSGDDRSVVTATCVKDKTEVAHVQINTVLNDKNEWKVDTADFYYQNYSFRTPSKVEVTVNGKVVGQEFMSKSNTGGFGMSCDWTLPYVGKKGVNVKLTCANYTIEKLLPTTGNNELASKGEDTYKLFYEIDAAEQEKIFTYIKDTWNAMYKDWLDGKNANDLLNTYLSDTADPDIATRIVDGFKSMSMAL